MITQRTTIIMAFCLLVTTMCFGQDEFKIYQPVRTTEPVKMDGRFDEQDWSKCARAGEFKSDREVGGTPARDQTCFRVLYDESNLYFAVECEEPQVDKIAANHKEHNVDVWKDDCVEIFVDSEYNRRTYCHFIVNTLGTRQESKDKNYLNEPWYACALVGTNSWQVEIAIPFTTLGVKPKPGMLMGLNVNREHYAGGFTEASCWSSFGGNGFHKPMNFGRLVFDPAACLQNTVSGARLEYERLRPELAEVVSRSGDIKVQEQFNRLDTEFKALSAAGKEKPNLEDLAVIGKLEDLIGQFKELKIIARHKQLRLVL